MKKYKGFIVIVVMSALLVGCGSASYTATASSTTETSVIQQFAEGIEKKETEKKQQEVLEWVRYCGSDVNEYRDKETGVHYFIFANYSANGYAGGMCPRYNADGTLYSD